MAYRVNQDDENPSSFLCQAFADPKWLQELKKIWRLWKKSETVQIKVYEFFESAENPYISALALMFQSDDFYHTKPSCLSYTVMEEFANWIINRPNKQHYLNADVKLKAFHTVIKQQNVSLIKLVSETYRLLDGKEQFLDKVKQMIINKNYKVACYTAAILKLHSYFSIEDFLIPLILQDKLSVVEDFLSGSPDHQQQLISYLDNLLGQRSGLRQALLSIVGRLDVPKIKPEKLYHKPLSKLITRFVKLYNIPQEIWPNLSQKQNEGALQFLIRRKYFEKGVGGESWREMVREAVGSNPDLQKEVVFSVTNCGDPEEGLFWAKEFAIPKSCWPCTVMDVDKKLKQERTCVGSKDVIEENWDTCPAAPRIEYHTLSLPESCIIDVNSVPALLKFLDEIITESIVGIDSEWKPSFSPWKNELSLLQVATNEKVYILDVFTLATQFSDLWKELAAKLFANHNIIKVGFGVEGDMSMINPSLPDTQGIKTKGINILDVHLLWKKLVSECSFKIPSPDDRTIITGESLSKLVEILLGRPLDKSEQFSNWERRPLRNEQRLYAALDAYCLMEIYNVLAEQSAKQEIPFSEICNEVMSDFQCPKVKKQHKKHKRESGKHEVAPSMEPSPHVDPIPARSFKVVCDTMVQGLGNQLRKCGVDTIILENGQDHDTCVKIAIREKRMILSRGQIFKRLCQHVPKGHCFDVASLDVNEQLKETLQYFNVIVAKDDVFSRCMACNSSEFAVVSQSVMNALYSTCQEKTAVTQQEKHTVPEETANWDYEETGFSSDSDAFSDEGIAPPTAQQYRSKNIDPNSGIDIDTCKTRKGVRIQVEGMYASILQRYEKFYICENCGKCFWDGTHFENYVASRLQNIIT